MPARVYELDYIGEVYCPVCGAKVYGEDSVECPHLLFVYEDGDLLYAQERIEEACEESEEGCGIDELVELSPPDSVVVVMSESGIACGPYSFDVAVGFAVPPGREIDVNEIVKRVGEEEKGWKI
ncbi:MAG: hypothetical protein LM580_02200 [Thermofilum sp.]|nr:hypothetical protein [Thermofilum sp.]